MKPKSFLKDIVSIIDQFLNTLEGHKFPDINDTSGKGYLLQGLFMNQIITNHVKT